MRFHSSRVRSLRGCDSLLLFALSHSLSTFPSLPCGEEPHGENETKQRRKMEHWFFFFRFVFTPSLLMAFFESLPFSRIIFSFLLAGHVWSSLSSSRTIHSQSASLLLFNEVSEGRGYSSRRIKWAKWSEWLWMFSCLFFPPQSHAPVDLYLMTKNPQDAPSTPDVLEIEFKNGAVMEPWTYRTCWLLAYNFSKVAVLLFHAVFLIVPLQNKSYHSISTLIWNTAEAANLVVCS